MPVAELNRVEKTVDGFDSIIIVKDLGDIPCGVTLDVSGWEESVIKAGALLVADKTSHVVKPLAIADGAFAALPGNHEYFGVLKSTILKAMPMAAVLRQGTVNKAAAAQSLGAEYPAEAIAALKLIDFIY